MHDNFRKEMAIGETIINVVELTQEAVTQSGSLRLANTTTRVMLQPPEVRASWGVAAGKSGM